MRRRRGWGWRRRDRRLVRPAVGFADYRGRSGWKQAGAEAIPPPCRPGGQVSGRASSLAREQRSHNLDQAAGADVLGGAEVVDEREHERHVQHAEGVGQLLALPVADAVYEAVKALVPVQPNLVLRLQAVTLLDEPAECILALG